MSGYTYAHGTVNKDLCLNAFCTDRTYRIHITFAGQYDPVRTDLLCKACTALVVNGHLRAQMQLKAGKPLPDHIKKTDVLNDQCIRIEVIKHLKCANDIRKLTFLDQRVYRYMHTALMQVTEAHCFF